MDGRGWVGRRVRTKKGGEGEIEEVGNVKTWRKRERSSF